MNIANGFNFEWGKKKEKKKKTVVERIMDEQRK